MSLKKVPPSLFLAAVVRFGLVLSLAFSFPLAQAADVAPDASVELAKDAPKESMFQAGKSYFYRVSDRLVDSVSGKTEE